MGGLRVPWLRKVVARNMPWVKVYIRQRKRQIHFRLPRPRQRFLWKQSYHLQWRQAHLKSSGWHSREETPKITSIRRAVATLFLQGKLCQFQWSNLYIAEFLSLQQGKVYSPSVGRISRWISSARSTFYGSVDKTVQSLTDNTSKEIALRKWVALYVPEIGLVIGRVCRITRTLKTSTSFPVLTFDKSRKSQQGVTKVWIREYEGITANENNPASVQENFKLHAT